ncbi:chemotaxis protein CheA [Paracoccus pacificus]|uniref:Chemotaxis protein CheA n=1 Tax=Paracoccus pacificus TaxID=1463598 RepID=A0ABW4R5D1_9RHOB
MSPDPISPHPTAPDPLAPDPMAQIRAGFFGECEELLETLHDALTTLEARTGDAETINVAFRAIHSIKGGAGAFGLQALTAFAHGFESVMDALRSGRLAPSPQTVGLLFRASDALQDHVAAARDGLPPPEAGAAVLSLLEGLAGGPTDGSAQPEIVFAPVSVDLDFATPDAQGKPEAMGQPEAMEGAGPQAAGCEPPVWLIEYTPHHRLFASANEPLIQLRALAALGAVAVVLHAPPEISIDDAAVETPCLSWTIRLTARVTEAEIRAVFAFVADLCDLRILRETPARQPAPDMPADMPASERTAATSDAAPVPAAGFASRHDPHPPLVHGPTLGAPGLPRPGMPPAPEQTPAVCVDTVRVDLEKIDRLVNLVGELVINQAMLAQSAQAAGLDSHPDVNAGLEAFTTLTRDIQDSVMLIRAQPIKPLFQRMARIAREAALAVGKTVRLRCTGEATELDKTVIERLADPLTHLIRNAVDHGLETPQSRLAAGKPSEGEITLSAFHRAGRVMIEVGDDGAGIDRGKVHRIARANRLIAADAAPGDAEIDGFLFMPGFSTAGRVSSLSGRGVGLDVVKSTIGALGGRISVHSAPGIGTRFSISLPLTLAVLDGMVVQAAGQTLVVPLSAIVETAILKPTSVKRVGPDLQVLHIRDRVVPLFDLGARLGFQGGGEMPERGIVLLTADDDGTSAALIVDAILDQRQVVIKGLGPGFGPMPGVAAATILGDGQVALILDPADLVRNAAPNARHNEIALAG